MIMNLDIDCQGEEKLVNHLAKLLNLSYSNVFQHLYDSRRAGELPPTSAFTQCAKCQAVFFSPERERGQLMIENIWI